MTVGSWKPASQGSREIHQELLRDFARLSREERLGDLRHALPDAQQQEQAFLMRLEESAWQGVLEDWSEEDIVHLVRFFTRAEMELPGWEGEAKSPVIWLVRQLKKRRTPPSKELCAWIKQHSTNRFLPHGSIP